MKTKKIFALLLALVMTLSLVACANQPPVSDDTSLDDSHLSQEVVDPDTTTPDIDNTDNTDNDNSIPDADAGTSDEQQSKDDTDTDSASKDNTAEQTKPSGSESSTKPTTSGSTASGSTGSSTADKNTTTDKTHTHSYTSKVVWPTCESAGYTLHTCSCGDSYKDTATKKLNHNYCEKVVAPTATAQGYTLYTCILCDDSYKANYTSVTGTSNSGSTGNSGSSTTTPTIPTTPTTPSTPTHKHNYTATVTAATCKAQGYTTYTCSCGDSYVDDYTNTAGHKWAEVYEEVEVYETVCITRCGHCHADITGFASAHAQEEALAGNGSRTYQSYEQVLVGTETQLVGYACSVCGTSK